MLHLLTLSHGLPVPSQGVVVRHLLARDSLYEPAPLHFHLSFLGIELLGAALIAGGH